MVATSTPGAEAKETDRRPVAGATTANTPAVGTKFAWRSGRVPQLLWTGFRLNPDGGEVLLQVSADVELEPRPSKDGVVFVLKKCRAIRRIDQLPLETRFFASPVTRVSVRQRAADLEIAIALRQPSTAVPRKEAGPGGSWFWVLSFPAAADTTTTAVAEP